MRWRGEPAIAGVFGSARPFPWSEPSHEYVKCVDSAWTLFNSALLFVILYTGIDLLL